jgi:hypothetical protein
MVMKSSAAVLKAVIAGVAVLASGQAQADIVKSAVRLGAFKLSPYYEDQVPLTTSGTQYVTFSGGGRFTIWYTAECSAEVYVDIDIYVDGRPIQPTGDNDNDSLCDFNTRGAMHTIMGRTDSLADTNHSVVIVSRPTNGLAYLSDTSLLIGK